MVDLKVLHLQLHTALFLRVNQFWQHGLPIARFEIALALSDALVRHTLMQLSVRARIVIQRVRDVHLFIKLR